MSEESRPIRLLLVYCGGTFGMRDAGNGLAARADLHVELETLMRTSSAHLGQAIAWELVEPERIIDSAEAGHGTALEIADIIRERVAAGETQGGGFRGVLVVHGTDTLAHSAAQTAFAVADLAIPIVFTGAQHPLGTPAGDAEGNFGDALAEAMTSDTGGVRIVFGGAILPAVRAVKRSSEQCDAFVARRPLVAPAAGVSNELASALSRAARAPAPRIGMLTMVPGLPAALLATALEVFPDGLVLECYGAGTAPLVHSAALSVLREARDRGTPVLAVTRCEHGEVDLTRYAVGAALAAVGVIGGADLTAEAAIAKLRALRRAGLSGECLERMFAANLIGEQHGNAGI